MQSSKNQQSIVRTDFTIKYMELESGLKSHPFYTVLGSDAHVFIRSWLDYSLRKGSVVIPWYSGGLLDLIKVYNAVTKRGINDQTDFESHLSKVQGVVFVVNFSSVDKGDLNHLLDIIKPLHSLKESGDSGKEVTKSGEAFTKVVLWVENKEGLTSEAFNHSTLFKTAFSIGKKVAIPQKRQFKLPHIALGAVAACTTITITGVLYWMSVPISENDASKLVDVVKPNQQTVVAENVELETDVSASLSAELKTATDIVAVKADEALQIETDAISATFIEPSLEETPVENSDHIVIDKGVVSTPLVIEELLINNEVVVSSDNTYLLKGHGNDLSIADISWPIEPEFSFVEHTEKPEQQSEKINISDVSSVETVNIHSSINTITNVTNDTEGQQSVVEGARNSLPQTNSKPEHEVEVGKFVDEWINGWQQQDFNKYSQSYHDAFSGEKGKSHQEWLVWRKQRIEKPEWIKISRSNIKYLQDQANQGVYQATFTLNYASPNYKDKTFKKLDIVVIDGHYKIIEEENLKVTRIR